MSHITVPGRSYSLISLLLVLLLFPFFFWLGPEQVGRSRAFAALWDLGHILFFALFVVVFPVADRRFAMWRPLWRLVIPLSVVLILGVTIEVLQREFFQRSFDVSDIAKNLLGAVLGLTWLFSATALGVFAYALWLARVAVISLVLWQAYPIVALFVDDRLAVRQFPLLADFESASELSRWARGSRSSEVASQGEFSLKVALTQEDFYTGTGLRFFANSWEGYKTLGVDIFVPADKAIELTLSIYDTEHAKRNGGYFDRFNREFVAVPGWNHITVELAEIQKAPRKREQDLARIKSLAIFAIDVKQPQVIYIDNVRLM